MQRQRATEKAVTEEPLFTIKELYQSVRAELERRKIKLGAIEYDSYDDDGTADEVSWFTYRYEPTDQAELDIAVGIDGDARQLMISYGPIVWEIYQRAYPKLAQKAWAEQIVDAIQRGLNGQICILLTYIDTYQDWQAAEQIWIDEQGAKRTIATVSNHTRLKGQLKTAVLCNHQKFLALTLAPKDLLHPQKVNGKYVLGRMIDLKNPTPLTKKMYNDFDNKLPAQLMGAETDEPLWRVFYKKIEFWVICLVIGLPLGWLALSLPDEPWWYVVVRQGIGLVGFFVIVFLTSFALMRRQAQLDAGQQPLGEKLEERLWQVNHRLIGLITSLAIAGTLFYAPLWTAEEAPQKLTTALTHPQLIPPLVGSVSAMVLAMVLIAPNSRRHKILRAIVFGFGYAGVLYCNTFVMYSGEDAASGELWAMLLGVALPFMLLIWYIIDCFRPAKPAREQRDWR